MENKIIITKNSDVKSLSDKDLSLTYEDVDNALMNDDTLTILQWKALNSLRLETKCEIIKRFKQISYK